MRDIYDPIPDKVMDNIRLIARCEVRDIPGWPGYAASIDGRIFSVRYPWRRPIEDRPIRQLKASDEGNCLQVQVVGTDGKGHDITVNRLVALTFLPVPEPGQDRAIHLDGDYRNNHANNLKWATSAEWGENKSLNRSDVRGVDHAKTYFTVQDILAIKRRIANGEGDRSIAADYHCPHSVIRSIRDGITWRDVGGVPDSPRPGRLKGEQVKAAKLTADDVKRMRKMRAEGQSVREIQAIYPTVTIDNIYQICARKTWRHIE